MQNPFSIPEPVAVMQCNLLYLESPVNQSPTRSRPLYETVDHSKNHPSCCCRRLSKPASAKIPDPFESRKDYRRPRRRMASAEVRKQEEEEEGLLQAHRTSPTTNHIGRGGGRIAIITKLLLRLPMGGLSIRYIPQPHPVRCVTGCMVGQSGAQRPGAPPAFRVSESSRGCG